MLIKHGGCTPRVDPTAKITSQLSETLGSHFFDEPGVQLLSFRSSSATALQRAASAWGE
jgi:hypothetical protein